jgi:hypothetical protein
MEELSEVFFFNMMWRLWAKSLGEKGSKKDHEADKIALIRTIIFMTYLITNIFICAGVIRHWNSNQDIYIQIETTETGIKL